MCSTVERVRVNNTKHHVIVRFFYNSGGGRAISISNLSVAKSAVRRRSQQQFPLSSVRPVPFSPPTPSPFFGFHTSFVWDRVRVSAFKPKRKGLLCNTRPFVRLQAQPAPRHGSFALSLSLSHCRLWIIDFFFARLQRGFLNQGHTHTHLHQRITAFSSTHHDTIALLARSSAKPFLPTVHTTIIIRTIR